MCRSLDLPFTNILARIEQGDEAVNIPLPAYGQRPGLRFDLSSITSNIEALYLDPRSPHDAAELAARSSLDNAQAKALSSSLTRSLALIQGPPGGKSYTRVALMKVLLANRGLRSLVLSSALRTTTTPLSIAGAPRRCWCQTDRPHWFTISEREASAAQTSHFSLRP